ncbi:hypothetical protein VC83_07693 [Pseudogymnoascus destructans]|uniref:Uncharacterized protein n=2 Tax=Pseudogymnoascus destructans TaxID=655981 RepID=L8FYJ1_PSED2|nr:uncharacterized protein VC83_07693 [Pseudogymnoascus destructans]ELR05584.1 hypothetical protein GMDG_01775 [Pseudogymnoascus destructans 20631-21]OAF55663.1 hypothetical protein VC83_07693 [Pseudogymnoascus destructans]
MSWILGPLPGAGKGPTVSVIRVHSKQVTPLEIGKTSSVEPGVYHKYQVGPEQTRRAMRTLMHADGKMAGLADSVLLMAVSTDLCDAQLIGPAAGMLEGVRAEKRDEVEAMKRELLGKYDTEAALRRLLAKFE